MSFHDVINWVGNQALKWIEGIVPWLGPGWGNYAVGVGPAILIAIGAGWIVREFWPWLIGRSRYRYPRVARKFVFVVKWARSFALNVLWLLGGAPLWIAFGGAAIAWISYLFYNLSFLARTRNRR